MRASRRIRQLMSALKSTALGRHASVRLISALDQHSAGHQNTLPAQPSMIRPLVFPLHTAPTTIQLSVAREAIKAEPPSLSLPSPGFVDQEVFRRDQKFFAIFSKTAYM